MVTYLTSDHETGLEGGESGELDTGVGRGGRLSITSRRGEGPNVWYWRVGFDLD